MNGDAPTDAKAQALGRLAVMLPRFSEPILTRLAERLSEHVPGRSKQPRLRVVGLPETAEG